MQNKHIYIIKRSFVQICHSFFKFFIFFPLGLFLTGCQVVEPEKRAYPLVVGMDWQGGEYQIYLGMAQLAESTGQGKEGGEEQPGNGSGALELTGISKEEILESYNSSRELYLDPGHVQAVVFGEGLVCEEERMIRVLQEMEGDTSLGNSAYVFGTKDVRNVFEKNGGQVQSLGEFLSGIYENRTSRRKPLALSDIYREIHNRGKVPGLSWITAGENQLFVDKAEEQDE